MRIIQSIGATESHQHVFQLPDVSTVQQHVRLVNDERPDVGEHVDMLRLERERSDVGRCCDDQIHRRLVAAQRDSVTEWLEVQGFRHATGHDGDAHDFIVPHILLFDDISDLQATCPPNDSLFATTAQRHGHPKHLLHEFLVGDENDRSRVVVGSFATVAVFLALDDIIDERQQVSQRLATSSFGTDRDISFAGRDLLERRCLNLRRSSEAELLKSLQQDVRLDT
mmetsp:Transcript_24554/g.68920  ORF Transcript_24554/g.68920 Transcript_24554/m.68920 type:complete len:225 (-) Transcript_24554:550-1224(-)